jgi:hypothetical protein
MPKFSAGLVLDFDLCECNWKDCATIQEKIARHCVKSEGNDVALGFVRITATESNNRLRGCIQRLLGYLPKNGEQDLDYIVARHHWNRQVLEHNGIDNRTIVLEDKVIELPKILGQDSKVKQLSGCLPEKLAKLLGYKEDSERCSSNRLIKEYRSFIQSPTAPKALVITWLSSLISDRGARQDRAPPPVVTPTTTLPPAHFQAFTSTMEPIKLEFKSVLCLGLKNPFVEAFADQGLSNRGFVSQHFSFCHSTNAWHSPLCSGSLQLQGGGLDQCSNCKNDSGATTIEYLESIYFAATLDTLSPVCSPEQIEIILRRQFEHFGGRLDAFKQCTVVQQCVRVFRDFHNGEGTIYLGECIGSKHYLRPCLAKGDGCLLFRVLQKHCQAPVGEGPCDSCRSKKRRKLEHPSRYTPYIYLTAEDAVKRLKELTREQNRIKRQLVCTTRLLEKEKDSCFVQASTSRIMSL